MNIFSRVNGETAGLKDMWLVEFMPNIYDKTLTTSTILLTINPMCPEGFRNWFTAHYGDNKTFKATSSCHTDDKYDKIKGDDIAERRAFLKVRAFQHQAIYEYMDDLKREIDILANIKNKVSKNAVFHAEWINEACK